MRIFYNLDTIKEVVEEIMPPKNNKYIGDFKLEFYISSKNWDYAENMVEVVNQRGFKYYIIKATLEQEIQYLASRLDEHFEYSDDHKYWMSQMDIKKRIKGLEHENQIWTLQELSKRLVQF